jgi:hypothetical protein
MYIYVNIPLQNLANSKIHFGLNKALLPQQENSIARIKLIRSSIIHYWSGLNPPSGVFRRHIRGPHCQTRKQCLIDPYSLACWSNLDCTTIFRAHMSPRAVSGGSGVKFGSRSNFSFQLRNAKRKQQELSLLLFL